MLRLILPSLIPLLFALLMLGLGVRWFTSPRDRDKVEKLFVLCCPAVPLFLFVVRYVLSALTKMSMPALDLYAYRMDVWMGYPTFRVAQLIQDHSWARSLAELSYDAFTLASVMVIGVYLWRRTNEVGHIAYAFFLNLALVVGFYFVAPICGPKYAFPAFPQLPAGIVPLRTLVLNAPPNGMPSAHVSNAFLILWFLRYWNWGVIAGSAFALLTMISVLSTGEHYFIDIIGALPYTCLVLYLSHGIQLRKEK